MYNDSCWLLRDIVSRWFRPCSLLLLLFYHPNYTNNNFVTLLFSIEKPYGHVLIYEKQSDINSIGLTCLTLGCGVNLISISHSPKIVLQDVWHQRPKTNRTELEPLLENNVEPIRTEPILEIQRNINKRRRKRIDFSVICFVKLWCFRDDQMTFDRLFYIFYLISV